MKDHYRVGFEIGSSKGRLERNFKDENLKVVLGSKGSPSVRLTSTPAART